MYSYNYQYIEVNPRSFGPGKLRPFGASMRQCRSESALAADWNIPPRAVQVG